MKKDFFCLFVCFGGEKTSTQPWCRLYSCSWFEAIVANRKCGREVSFFLISTSFLLYVSLSLMLPSQEMWSTGFSCFSQEVWTKRGGVSLSFLIIILWASSSFSKCCDFLSSRLNMLELFRGGLEVCVWSDSLILPRQIHSRFSRKQISSQTFWWYTATICV